MRVGEADPSCPSKWRVSLGDYRFKDILSAGCQQMLKRVSVGFSHPLQEHFSTAHVWQSRQPWSTGHQAGSNSPAWPRAAGERKERLWH